MTSSLRRIQTIATLLTLLLYLGNFSAVCDPASSSDGHVSEEVDSNSIAGQDAPAQPSGPLDHYGYSRVDGPKEWAHMFATCAGTRQSPINLDTTTAITVHKPLQNWWGYALKPHAMHLTNNGHTVVLSGEWDPSEVPHNWDFDSQDMYVFDQLHFHWGPNDAVGSEHTLNNEKFPLEMHAVHHRRQLGTLADAAKVEGGLKVIGILFRISEHNNPGLSEVLAALPRVQQSLDTTVVPPFTLNKLLPQFRKQYLTYNGSLTTPPCSESVKWVVYKQASTISRNQVEKFRHFKNEGTVINQNFRPPQPLNDRIVQQIR